MNLVKVLLNKGLTREEIAYRVGVSVRSVEYWEKEQKRPIPAFQRRLEELLREKRKEA